MKTGILFLAAIMLLSFGCAGNDDLSRDGNAINTEINEQDTTAFSDDLSKDVGYIVDYYQCTGGFKGYYIISENLKDTLIAYNLPDVYKDSLEFYDKEKPGYSYRYEYKIEFVYTIAGEEDIPACLALYYIRYPYAKQIIVKSASKL